MDIAISVLQKKTNKRGFIILHSGDKNYFVIGAGTAIGRGGDNHLWLDSWRLYKKDKVKVGFGETEELNLTGDALFVENYLFANALIYWTGKEVSIPPTPYSSNLSWFIILR